MYLILTLAFVLLISLSLSVYSYGILSGNTEKRKEYENYFNLDISNCISLKYFCYAVFVSFILFPLKYSGILVLASISHITEVVVLLLAWCWFFDCLYKGLVTEWISDGTEKFKNK